MRIDLNTRTLLLLLALSCLSIIMHRIGVFNTHFDFLDASKGFAHVSNRDSSSTVSHEFKDSTLSMACSINETEGYRYCGTAIRLNEDPSKGYDLTSYENILLDVEFKTPLSNQPNTYNPMRLMLRNFDAAYSTKDNTSSLKYNTIQFEPSKELFEKPIPLQSLQVSSWWIHQYKISYEEAQPDLSNVSLIEFETGNAKAIGDYTIIVKKFVLQGNLFSESALLKFLLALWLSASILMVKRQHQALTVLSNQDPLTGLVNRRGLNRWLDRYFSSGNGTHNIVMFYIDIDDFKTINDTYGHLVGDHLLREFCLTIKNELNNIRINDIANDYILARLSGDEFALIVDGVNDVQMTDIGNRLIKRFGEIIIVDGAEITVNASIGIARNPKGLQSPTILMGHADAAMYHSKKNGKNQYKIFDDKVHEDILFRKHISSSLRHAIENQLFSLVFMPIYNSSPLKLHGAEVLLRCTSEELHSVGPDIFIPIAEEYGLIREIDLWVIESTFKHIAEHKACIDDKVFCINISALELINPAFPNKLEALLEKYDIPPGQIELELTETSLIDVDENSIALLHALRELGVGLALDDFGTGYTAFNQLINYPVSSLKIDRAFVNSLDSLGKDSLMVDVILAIAESYELNVIAEGVETEYQQAYLTNKNCQFLQGYHLSKPVAWPVFKSFLLADKADKSA